MKITWDKWRGELYRYSRTLTPDGFAQCAINTKLSNGILQSFPCPTLACEKAFDIGTMVEGCDCLAFPEKVDIVKGFCDLNFMTGRAYPEVTDDLCGEWCRLGVPCPTNAPNVSSSSSCEGGMGQVVYRYVNKFGHVGSPSYPSSPVSTGGAATVSGILTPDAEWCVTEVDVFVSMSGIKTGNEATVNENTATMFVGRFPIASSVGVDTSVSAGAFELDSLDNAPPVDGLLGIVSTESGLAGFEGKTVWYTKPNQPNAWSNSFCVDHQIKAIKYWNNKLFVLTDCLLYVFDERVSQTGYEFSASPFTYGGKKLPLVGNRCSVAVGQAGIFYPSTHGLVFANQGSARVVSDEAFGRDGWFRINPESMVSVYSDYGYMFFNDDVSYVFEVKDGTFEGDRLNNYRLNFKADAAMVDCDGNLNYADGQNWYVWDQSRGIKKTFGCDDGRCLCTDCCPYHYESDTKRLAQEQRITDGVIVFDGTFGSTELKIWDSSCRKRLLYSGEFTINTEDCGNIQCDRKYFVLDSCAMVGNLYIELDGCADVISVSLATRRSEL